MKRFVFLTRVIHRCPLPIGIKSVITAILLLSEGGEGPEGAAGEHLLQLPGRPHDERLSGAPGPAEDYQESQRVPVQNGRFQ